ncbi:MAG: DNA repair protein RecO [Elusimicrobia bacterium]|nr:DNA repair protein RecO [Elusimicrobiota bacterium]
MYFCDKGIVLRQRPLRDSDKIVTVFTENYGRLEISFKSVRKQKAKLRPLSETFVMGDFRFYAKNGSALPVCTGGKIISVFPSLRSNNTKILNAFYICELMVNLTPLGQPAKEKFNLLKNALEYLEKEEKNSFLLLSYSLLLLEYCGVGFRKSNLGFDESIWENLHKDDFSGLKELKEDSRTFDLIESYVIDKVREHSGREINSLKFVKI